MISASVGVNSSLLLEPAQTLTFALDPAAGSARACLTLTNISPRKHVVFKVRTTNVDMFMVKPAQGVIEPSGEVPIVITLLPDAGARLLRMAPQERAALIERFLIQSIDRAEDMLGFSVDDLATFWKRLPKELITNKKLTCRFVEARDGEPDVHLPMQRMRLHADEPARAPTPVFAAQVPAPQPQPRSPVKDETPQTSPAQTTSRDPQLQVRLSNKHDAKKPKPKPQLQVPPPPPPPPPPVSAPGARVGARPGRTPPIAMNMPSSPVPSLRPKPVVVHHSSSSSNSSHGSNQSGHDEQRDDIGTGISNVSSNDSYATNRVAQMQFDERIQSDDTLEYRLHPSESLLFPVHHAYPDDSPTGIVEGKSYFFITNKARYSGLAFKIKTSNHTGYFVKPARGFIDAKSAQRVDVFVNAPDAARFDAQSREMKDRFLVEMLFVGPAKSSEMLALSDDQRRQELQHIWDQSKAADRRQSVLACQILEEDSPIDPSHQTAEQARALLQKSQVATTLSFNNNSPVPRETAGESANPWIHARPTSAVTSPVGSMHTPRGQQPPQYNQQVRSPVMQQSRSPVKQAPRSPGIPSAQVRSPVRQPHLQQHQQYYTGPPRPQRAAFDDDGTFYP